jgi:hypothetical protein
MLQVLILTLLFACGDKDVDSAQQEPAEDTSVE